jgi:hypothetical protein
VIDVVHAYYLIKVVACHHLDKMVLLCVKSNHHFHLADFITHKMTILRAPVWRGTFYVLDDDLFIVIFVVCADVGEGVVGGCKILIFIFSR